MPQAVIYATAAFLFLGALPLPYGFYVLLRLVACVVFAFAAYVSVGRGHKTLPWFLGFLALVFNPIIQVHFSKEVWALVDIGSAIFLLAVSKRLTSKS